MLEYFHDMWSGPGHLRFFLQPLLALILGVRDGLNDAKLGKAPYALALLKERDHRGANAKEALKHLAIPLTLGVALSIVFQLVIRGRAHLLLALIYGVLLIGFPYILARGLTNRAAKRRRIHAS